VKERRLRKILSIILCLLLVATVLVVAEGVNASDNNYVTPGRVVFDSTFMKVYSWNVWDHRSDHDQYIRNVADWLQRGSAIGTNILIYNTWQSGSGYSKVKFTPNADSVLTSYGCTVTLTDRSIMSQLTSSILQSYDQLWIINGQANSLGVFSSVEVQTIYDFNQNGNGLMLISDHDDKPSGWDYDWTADVDQIAARYNVEFDHFIDILDVYDVVAPDFDVSHPIWTGVNEVDCGTDSEIITTNPDVIIIASPDGWPTIAVIDPPVPIKATIDIKPGSDVNTINLGSNGVIPVAILSTENFDATQVDPETVMLAGAGVAVKGKGSKLLSNKEDVNGDGLNDLVVKVVTSNLDLGQFQEGWAILTGEMYDGTLIEGKDTVNIVPP
jgi:hypothetical protein